MSMGSRLLIVIIGAAIAAGGLLVGCDGGGYSPTTGPIDGAKAMAHAKVMVGHGPRPSGSPALNLTRIYIKDQLKKLGLTVNKQRLPDPSKPKIPKFENIWAQIDGADPKDGPILILGAHYDTKLCEGHADPKHNIHFVGAIDGAGGPAVLLELAGHLVKRKNIPNIWLLFIDGEESIPWDWGDGDQALYGSKYFVQKMGKHAAGRPISTFVLIDLVGSKNAKIDRDANSNSGLSDLYLEAAKTIGGEERMYEFDSTMTDDHLPFKKYGVKVIDLIDFYHRAPAGSSDSRFAQWWHTEDDNLDAMDPVSLAFFGNLLWASMPLLEAKYFPAKK